MARLQLSLLGTFRATLDGVALTAFGYDKVRALLAYLAVESDRPHHRETLAGLLWPEQPERSARLNLSQALSRLRRVLDDERADPPFVDVTRQTLQFNPASDHWLDAVAFIQALDGCEKHAHERLEDCGECLERLEGAAALYRGAFMEGFSIADSPAFEEWALLQRERLHRLAQETLHRLASSYAARGAYEKGLLHAWRQMELDPWREAAQRQLMRLLALSGQRGAALAQYEVCRRLLAEELDVEPAQETTALYEMIRDGTLTEGVSDQTRTYPVDRSVHQPAFLAEGARREVERPVFVAREEELAQLEACLKAALTGRGQVVFITGGPGRGKTALMHEFTRRALRAEPDLLIASGACNAYSGVGDPYLPFREIVAMLTGDVETRWTAGVISTEHARRLWAALPDMTQALLDRGPYLIDALVPGPVLLDRATAAALVLRDAHGDDRSGWLAQLQDWVGRAKSGHSGLEQRALFTQFTNTLCALSETYPLLLTLDDLQWTDAGSVGLLFHLGRHLVEAGSRLLIVGAYRPEEVTRLRDGKDHPLIKVLTEFQRQWGDVQIDLGRPDKTGGRRFVQALLDSEPHCLGNGFREALIRRTGGHALFTIELLRTMQARGDLIRDAEGRWFESRDLEWETLPARVEAVIQARLDPLSEGLRDLLRVASVEGEHFTAQVVAQAQGVPEREVFRALSQELGRRGQRLVREAGEVQIAGRYLARYQFAHALFQEYLYQGLSAGERRLLHGEVGRGLETLYRDQADEVAAQLAHHYDMAGMTDKAIPYMLLAGNRARQAYANEEAIVHYQRALKLLGPAQDLGREEQAFRMLALKGLGQTVYGMGNSAQAEGYLREAIALGKQIGKTPRELLWLYYWLAETIFWQERYDEHMRVAEEGLALLRAAVPSNTDVTESLEAALMCHHISVALDWKGDSEAADALVGRFSEVIQRSPYCEELGPLYYQAISHIGYNHKDPAQAIQWARQLEERANQHNDLRGTGQAKYLESHMLWNLGDGRRALLVCQQARDLFDKIGDLKLESWCLEYLTFWSLQLGDLEGAEAYASKSLKVHRTVGHKGWWGRALRYSGLVSLCREAWNNAIDAFKEAIWLRQELGRHRVQAVSTFYLGQVHLSQGDAKSALECFQEALWLVGSPRIPLEVEYLARILGGLEEAFQDPEAFREYCCRFRRDHPEVSSANRLQWYLEPSALMALEQTPLQIDVALASLTWVWHDPFGDCAYTVGSTLEIHAANNRDFWNTNRSAPRLLRPAPDCTDWVAQTACCPVKAPAGGEQKPAMGGLLLWQDEGNYLRIDLGTSGERDVTFQGCMGNENVIIGRGRLPVSEDPDRVHLCLERVGEQVRALCSRDGEAWFSAGEVTFPSGGSPMQVGLHAIGNTFRTVHRGAFPDGTAIGFESFTVWELDSRRRQ